MLREDESRRWTALCSLPSWIHRAPQRSHEALGQGLMTITICNESHTGHRCIATSLGSPRFVGSEGRMAGDAIDRSLVANHGQSA
jgi:hypothetical protein